MDLLYVISQKSVCKSHIYNGCVEVYDDLKGLIRVSSGNVVAWVTKYELCDFQDFSLGSRVYIADLNIPWSFYKVTSNDNMITLLEWSLSGENLLIGDDSGTISVWSYKDYIFNDWTCLGTLNLLGEYMIAGTFFHYGRKIVLVPEKKDNINYYEKFNFDRFSPTVKAPGGTFMDGYLLITSTGLLVACIVSNCINEPLITTTESISSVRYKISVADIAYSKNGNLIIAASCGSVKMPIKCYQVSVNYINKKSFTLTSQPLAGFFLDSSSLDKSLDWYISHVKFVVKDHSNSLIVVANSKDSSIIQIWELTGNGACQLNHIFNERTINGDNFNWKCKHNYLAENPVVSVSVPKMVMSNSVNVSCYIMLAFTNNKIRAFSRLLKEEFSYNLDLYWDVKDVKKVFRNIRVTDIDVSWLGNVMLALDNMGNFYVIQIQNVAELGGPLTVSYATIMLEYCLISGFDFWDVVIAMKPHLLETVCERFSENFSKQCLAVQQLEYGSFLSMKAFIYRMSSSSFQKHCDLLFLLTLYSISVSFKSLLRPPELSNPDKGPGESLSSVLLESISDVNLNSIIMNIEPKEFSVDPIMLQSLQQLIQWVAHLALNILSRIPEHRKTIGYDIVNDNHALNILREVLVIIRIWGFMKQSYLPVFVKNVANFDGLSTLFRLISRLVQCNQSNEIDELFIDECYLLQNQVLIPSLTSATQEIYDVASPAFYRHSLPLHFTFGLEPESTFYETENFSLDMTVQIKQTADIIRHVYLGNSNPYKIKQCNRCQGKTQVVNTCKSVAIRSWENRWIRSCLCGGKWRFIKSVQPPYYTPKKSKY